MSVWDSWQRHLGNPELTPEADGTWNLFRAGQARPAVVPAWVYAFDLDAIAATSPGPIVLSKIIATDAQSMSYYALEVAPTVALDNISSPTGMLSLLARRLVRLWPELAATLTA